MKQSKRTFIHGLEHVWEDLEVLGGSSWQGSCVCGWRTRHCASPGVVVGLLRRHAVLAGR